MRVALAVSLVLLAVLAPAAAADTRLIVARAPGLSAAERADLRQDAGVRHVETLPLPHTEVVTVPSAAARDALRALNADPDVRYAERDRVRRAFAGDRLMGYQWALDNTGHNLDDWFGDEAPASVPDADMDVLEAWDRDAVGADVAVAVVDSGIDAEHPDLAGQVDLDRSAGFVSDDAHVVDPSFADGDGHGTHVAGIVAAARDNGGVVGIAPSARIVALKALDDEGRGRDSDIAAAFDRAGQLGIPIVNASLGGPGASETLTRAIASHPGTLYVFAAGNDGVDNDAVDVWPCDAPAPNVVCVGASTQADEAAPYSDYGRADVDLFAPGDLILSTTPDGRYGFMSGTSMAAPAVAAEAALALGAAPGLTTAELKDVLLAAVDPSPAFACRSVTGGRANADLAVQLAGTSPAPVDPDCDGDGVRDSVDRCATVQGTDHGCPPPTPPPATTPPATTTTTTTPPPRTAAPPVRPAPLDRDRDGRPDTADACPDEAAATASGCPAPAVRSMAVAVARSHRVRVRVRADRATTVSIRIDRRRCDRHGRHCRWRRASTGTLLAAHGRATFSRRLAPGRYRVSVRLVNDDGRSRLARRSFRVR